MPRHWFLIPVPNKRNQSGKITDTGSKAGNTQDMCGTSYGARQQVRKF